jgi:predicted O-methyltransferase YrrM
MDTDAGLASVANDPAVRSALTAAWQTLSRFDVATPQDPDLFEFFRSLRDVLDMLKASGRIDTVDAIMPHVDYLANKADCSTEVILGGGRFLVHQQITWEALSHIGTILQMAAPKGSEKPPEGFPDDVFSMIVEAEEKLTGWCTREKALVISNIVLQERPQSCVEIGIFGGRSLVPCAAALRHNGTGAIYGIEAWNPQVAIENATDAGNDEWWSKVDFAEIKRAFFQFVAANDLTQQVRVIEAPSGRAAALFDQIDFLHIDGSHSLVNAVEDVILYARKVRSGGIVVFDDINWPSTAPARELLMVLCDVVTTLKDADTGMDVCAVLRRR